MSHCRTTHQSVLLLIIVVLTFAGVCAVLGLVTQPCPTLCDPMDHSPPGSSVHRDPAEREYRRGLPSPPPEDLPDPGIEPGSPALQADSLPAELPGKPLISVCQIKKKGCLSQVFTDEVGVSSRQIQGRPSSRSITCVNHGSLKDKARFRKKFEKGTRM